MSRLIGTALSRVQQVDTRLSRRSGRRRILVDARTPVNYTMVAPVVRAIASDPRVEFYFTASEEPHRLSDIYREAVGVRTLDPRRAALMKFDAYVASDFMWASLPRGTQRVQVFHGVGGKYGFDVPDTSMRDWDWLFFVNERAFATSSRPAQLNPIVRRFGSSACRRPTASSTARSIAIGPAVARASIPPGRRFLYAPRGVVAGIIHLNAMGLELVQQAPPAVPVNLMVKLHDRSRDLRERYSGGVDWVARLQPLDGTWPQRDRTGPRHLAVPGRGSASVDH